MYICLPAWGYIRTYMCMGKTWLLFEIRHFHVAFKFVCGSPTYSYCRYVNSATYKSCFLFDVNRKG